MRIRGLTLGLALLGAMTACDTSRIGAMTVAWSFGGGNCSGAAVEQVRIAIAGERLSPDTFDCRSGLATFTDFYPGTYVVTVQGLDGTQAVTWSGSKSVRLDGDVSVMVDLQPLSSQNAVAYLSWTLDPATGDSNQIPRCGQGQRLDSVALFVDDVNNGTYQCEQGTGGGVVITTYQAPGQHKVDLVAYSSQEGVTGYAESGPLQINFVSGKATSQTVPLHWNVGGLQVGWAPYASIGDYNADLRQSCAQAGIADLVLGFFTAQAAGPTFGLGSSCNASVVLDNVYSGTWTPYIDACAAGGTAGSCGLTGGPKPIYREDPSLVSPPSVTVRPGAFFDSTRATDFQVFIPLFRI